MIEFVKVLIISFKRLILSIHKNRQYFKKFGYLPPQSTIALGLENLKIGLNFSFGIGCEFYSQSSDKSGDGKITIGNNVSLNSHVMLNADCGGDIQIGNNVLIGPNVIIRASNHAFSDLSKPMKDQGHIPGKIILEDDVWIGAGAIILPDVTIKRGSIVAAGAVVSKSTEAYSINAGVPAKLIKVRE